MDAPQGYTGTGDMADVGITAPEEFRTFSNNSGEALSLMSDHQFPTETFMTFTTSVTHYKDALAALAERLTAVNSGEATLDTLVSFVAEANSYTAAVLQDADSVTQEAQATEFINYMRSQAEEVRQRLQLLEHWITNILSVPKEDANDPIHMSEENLPGSEETAALVERVREQLPPEYQGLSLDQLPGDVWEWILTKVSPRDQIALKLASKKLSDINEEFITTANSGAVSLEYQILSLKSQLEATKSVELRSFEHIRALNLGVRQKKIILDANTTYKFHLYCEVHAFEDLNPQLVGEWIIHAGGKITALQSADLATTRGVSFTVEAGGVIDGVLGGNFTVNGGTIINYMAGDVFFSTTDGGVLFFSERANTDRMQKIDGVPAVYLVDQEIEIYLEGIEQSNVKILTSTGEDFVPYQRKR